MPTAPLSPARAAQLAALYAAFAEHLEAWTASRVQADRAVVQDACQFAWVTAATRAHVDLSGVRVHGWLRVTALREAWRLAAQEGLALEAAPEPTGGLDDVALIAIERVADRQRRQHFERLPAGQRQVLVLQAAGYRYTEIAELTGLTWRQVDRRLARGRARLRDFEAAGG